eukprot:234505-Rhodomonas_salina.1
MVHDPDTNTTTLLEFTRCLDSRHDALLEAVERKEIKYQELLDDLRLHNPTLRFELCTFAIGYLGSLNKPALCDQLCRLRVPEETHGKICQTVITATLAAFGKMANERQKVLSKYNKEAREVLAPQQHQTWTKRQRVPTTTARNPQSGAGTGLRKLRAKVTLAELTRRQPTDTDTTTTRTATATTEQTTQQTATTRPRPRKKPDGT